MVADVSTCEASIARDRLADVLACIALVLLCLMPFWPVFLGEVLVPFDGLYLADAAFAAFRPPHVTWPMRFTGDLVFQMYPWRLFTTDGLAAGYIPLWNPYAGCGQSFIGNNQSALCNPTNLLLNLFLPAATGQTVFSLLTLIGACLFTYALTRSLRGPPSGAFLAAFTYGFGGFMFVWLGFPLAATAMWLPALLLATLRLALRPTAIRAVPVSITIGWQLVSGHLSTSAQTLAFWGAFLCYEWIIYRRRRGVGWARGFVAYAALALLLGAGLGMPQLLPLRESFGLSSMSSAGRSGRSSEDPAEEVRRALLGDGEFLREIALEEAALLVLPERHGNDAFGDYRQQRSYDNYWERSIYIGFLGLFAILVGLMLRPHTGHERFFLWASLVLLGILLHLPILNSATYPPVLRYTNPGRLRFIFTLCGAVWLGLSVRAWFAPTRSGSRQRVLLWLVALALSLLSGVLALLTLRAISQEWVPLLYHDRLLRLVKLFAPALVGLLVSLVLLLSALRWLSLRRAMGALVALAVIDMLVFAARLHVTSRTPSPPQTPLIEAARAMAQGHRIIGPLSGGNFSPNIAMAYGLRDARLYDPLRSARYVGLVEGLTGRSPGRQLLSGDPVSGLDRLSVLGRVTSAKVAWRWWQSRGVWLQELPDPLPHAYVAAGVEPASSVRALAMLAAPVDPWRTTFIEGTSAAGCSHPGVATPADVVLYDPDTVEVHAYAEGPGWLVLTDTYDPGWTATVNGVPEEIFIANYAFRGVPIPAGDVVVNFAYRPASCHIGLFLGLVTMLVCSALVSCWACTALQGRLQHHDLGGIG
jgi:hypothetical protein